MKPTDIVTYKRVHPQQNEHKLQQMIRDGTIFASVAGMLVSRGNLLGCMAPFGIAWYAANSSLDSSGLMLVCCAAGVLLMNLGLLKLKYIVMLLAFWAIRKYYHTERWEQTNFTSAVAAGLTLVCGLVITAFGGFLFYDALINVFEAAAVWGSCIIFSRVSHVIERKGQVATDEESVAIAILAGAAVAGLQGAELFGVKLANVLSMYIILFTAYKGGVGISGAAGAALGIITGMAQGDAPAITGVYAFVGLIAGVMNIFGKVGVVCAATFANALFSAYYNSSVIILINIFEILIAGGLFFLTPERVLNYFERFSIKSETYNPSTGYMLRVRQQATEAFERFKTALHGMTQAFEAPPEDSGEHKAAILCDRLAARVCDNCSLNKYCWTRNFKGTSGMFSAIVQMLYEGHEDRLTELISGRCVRGDVLTSTAVSLYDIYRREGLMEQRAKECSCYTVKQWEKLASMVDVYEKRTQEDCNGYEQFSSEICRALAEYSVKDAQVNVIKNQSGLYEVLIKTEEELSFDVESVVEEVLEKRMHLSSERHAKDGWILNLEEQEAYEYDVAVVTMDKLSTSETGDSGHWFAAPGGKLYCVISDGMGSGSDAAQDSQKIVKIFEELATSGFEMQDIAGIINAGLISRGGQERCATLDCACINLFTGSVEILKAGAAASIVKTSDNTELVRYNSMPLGILNVENIQTCHLNLEGDSYLVMMTDGVPDNKGDRFRGEEFVKTVVGLSDDISAKEMADSILMSALAGSKPRDDMMVMTAKLSKAS